MALSLLLSGDVTLPDMKPGCLSLSVRTLIAELHEGLFLSQLLLPTSPPKSIHEAHTEQMQGMISEIIIRINKQKVQMTMLVNHQALLSYFSFFLLILNSLIYLFIYLFIYVPI